MERSPKKRRVEVDEADVVRACITSPCLGELDAHVKATAVAMFEAFLQVDECLRESLPDAQLKPAYKILEQLWMEAMQGDSAAGLSVNPMESLLENDTALHTAETLWKKRNLAASVWDDVVEIVSTPSERIAELTEAFNSADTTESITTPTMRGAEVMKQDHLVWQEVNDTYSAQKKAVFVEKFEGKVLQWKIKSKGVETTLLTRPLVSSSLEELAELEPLQLCVHTLVYGSMFVTGQAMGLSPRFHAALSKENWATEGDVSLEMFSHLVNRRSAPHPFLSMIPRADGSFGRVQDLSLERFVDRLVGRGVLYCNPPYVEAVMDRDLPAVVACLKRAEEQKKCLTVVSLMPDWVDNAGVAAILESPHLASHWLLAKNRHMACLENGTEVTMGVSQRLCLLTTARDRDYMLAPALWANIAPSPKDTPVVPDDCNII